MPTNTTNNINNNKSSTVNNTSTSSTTSTTSTKYNNNKNMPSEPSFSKKKSSRLSKPRPCSIYTGVSIPGCTPSNNNHGLTSPIPSGHLETSSRFWEFRVEEGLITYIRYGSIRADGTLKERATHIQQHPCYCDARQFVEKLVDEKIKAGYVGWARW